MRISLFFTYLIFTVLICGSCERVADMQINSEPVVEENTTVPKPRVAERDSVTITAEIVGVIDGDTVKALYNDELLLKVRLAHIDAPEKRNSQPFGKASKQMLSDLCFGQTVQLVSKGQGERDRYGRIIAVVFNEQNVNCNRHMVRMGMAWHFKKYSTSQVYSDLENSARTRQVGLWRDPNPIPPWNWRKP